MKRGKLKAMEPSQAPKAGPLDRAEVRYLLGPKGPIARRLPGYEVWEGQLQLAEVVARAFGEGGITCLEGGVGIGKSFAYLVPALLWAARTGERVLVSTHTILLQEQLLQKDLPLLLQALEGQLKTIREKKAVSALRRALPRLRRACRETRPLVRAWEEALAALLGEPPNEEPVARRLERLTAQPSWSAAAHMSTALTQALGTLPMEDVLDPLARLSGQLRPEDPLIDLAFELKVLAARFESQAALLQTAAEGGRPGQVWWVERARGQRPTLHVAPLAVGPTLAEQLWPRFKTAVLTSATLAIRGNFHPLINWLGLEASTSKTLVLPSPFNYRDHVLLEIPVDLPDPTDPGFSEASIAAIRDAVLASRGGALVLFTAHRALRQAAEALREPLQQAGIPLLVQGEAPRHALLDTFRQDRDATLLATASFWEGIDVPGEALRLLILVKLPFAVPEDPVVEARAAWLKAQGHDPFLEDLLSRAALRLRQGFGRLIRTATDRGVVLLLDLRVVTKFYGLAFLEALPETQRCISPWPTVLQAVQAFFQATGDSAHDG